MGISSQDPATAAAADPPPPQAGVTRAAVLAVLAALLAGVVTAVGAAPASARVGFHDVSPSDHSTVNTNSFSFTVQTSLIPDGLINPPKVDWGDGTSSTVEPYCKLASNGRQVPMRECLADVPGYPIPYAVGTIHIGGSHAYPRPGKYKAVLTYRSLGAAYTATWWVVSPGTPTALNLAYDANAMSVKLDPAPISPSEGSTFNYDRPGTYSYIPGTEVTVTATPRTGYDITTWNRVYCDLQCWKNYEPVERNEICPSGSRTCKITIAPIGNGHFQEPHDTGVKTLEIGHKAGNLVANGSFESWDVPRNGWNLFDPGSVPMWGSNRAIEIQDRDPGGPDPAADGDQYVEMDSDASNAIWQHIPTEPGKTYQLTYSFSARPGTPVADNKVQIHWNGKSLGWVQQDGTGKAKNEWYTRGTRVVGGTGRYSELKFTDIGTSNGLGGYLDNVRLVAID